MKVYSETLLYAEAGTHLLIFDIKENIFRVINPKGIIIRRIPDLQNISEILWCEWYYKILFDISKFELN